MRDIDRHPLTTRLRDDVHGRVARDSLGTLRASARTAARGGAAQSTLLSDAAGPWGWGGTGHRSTAPPRNSAPSVPIHSSGHPSLMSKERCLPPSSFCTIFHSCLLYLISLLVLTANVIPKTNTQSQNSWLAMKLTRCNHDLLRRDFNQTLCHMCAPFLRTLRVHLCIVFKINS